ncbi:hypothetical protein JG688_00005038 [Phytophthora aleatoria]|uniref:Uncharacterized protein n=1 Tax=Phytophthora aleatoria TaxID=2496075 RepID=A0A8J5MHT5_9STRA|nr:hypothetical protein JG688_00005038 [Phytophthora aleatoria]
MQGASLREWVIVQRLLLAERERSQARRRRAMELEVQRDGADHVLLREHQNELARLRQDGVAAELRVRQLMQWDLRWHREASLEQLYQVTQLLRMLRQLRHDEERAVLRSMTEGNGSVDGVTAWRRTTFTSRVRAIRTTRQQ